MLYLINDSTLTGIAEAIRDKVSSSEMINPTDMPELIRGIESGGKTINGACVDNDTPVVVTDPYIDCGAFGSVITLRVTEG